MDEFFLVALPGLEDLVAAEVSRRFPDLESKTTHGGVTVRAPRAQALSLNQNLKTPTRILLRVKTFRCRDFPKLYQTIRGTNWSEWLKPDADIEVEASSRLSRLKIKRRIEETCLEGFKDQQKKRGTPVSVNSTIKLFVRFHSDECTLSLDTSGERLHKRGEKPLVGLAPLRETVAAALLEWLDQESSAEGPVEIIDPMMGSGTFLFEAAMRDEPVRSREFAAQALMGAGGGPIVAAAPSPRHPLTAVIGYERDTKTYRAAVKNLAGLKNLRNLRVDLLSTDFFTAEPISSRENERWVLANPPYGERLKIRGPLKHYYEDFFAAIERVTRPDLVAIILPAKAIKGKFNLPATWKVKAKRPFLNGGIPVVAFLFAR